MESNSSHLQVAFQGVEGAYSHQAIKEYFFDQATEPVVRAQPTFEGVFRALKNRRCDFGMIPIENSLAGSIHQNYDLLLQYPVWIAGEYKLRIKHSLLALPQSKLANIKRIHSHPQALSQCSEFLSQLKGVEIVPSFDTAGSAKLIRDQQLKDSAAIAGTEAAAVYGLKRLRVQIENNEANFTRFFLLSKNKKLTLPSVATAEWKTSIVFSLKNIPGGLYKSLSIFAIRDIDLLKIESRPIAGSPWRYMFYLDFSGRSDQEAGARAIEHLREITEDLKILGCYPACQRWKEKV